MSPLQAVTRLIECPLGRAGLAAELGNALAGETRLSMRTRLGLVAMAVRLESGEGVCKPDCPPGGWIDSLARAAERDEASALEALVACAPQLRAAVARGSRQACALAAAALLELLRARLH